jgi:hypothetical protein
MSWQKKRSSSNDSNNANTSSNNRLETILNVPKLKDIELPKNNQKRSRFERGVIDSNEINDGNNVSNVTLKDKDSKQPQSAEQRVITLSPIRKKVIFSFSTNENVTCSLEKEQYEMIRSNILTKRDIKYITIRECDEKEILVNLDNVQCINVTDEN